MNVDKFDSLWDQMAIEFLSVVPSWYAVEWEDFECAFWAWDGL
jgi:hypothetical protein